MIHLIRHGDLVELRLDDVSSYEVGQEISGDLLEAGERVDVTAISKGGDMESESQRS